MQVVQTFERIVVFRLGRLLDSKGPGLRITLHDLDVISISQKNILNVLFNQLMFPLVVIYCF